MITLLGTFVAPHGVADCYVIDWGYPSPVREYRDDQIVMPEDSSFGPLRAGVAVDIRLLAEGEIPVYLEHDGDALQRLIVATDLWVDIGGHPALLEIGAAIAAQSDEQSRSELVGYVTATGYAILVTEVDFIYVCYDQIDFDDSQITAPDEGDDDPAFRAGIYLGVVCDKEDQEYPVFREYEQDVLVRVVVDFRDADVKVLWNRPSQTRQAQEERAATARREAT